MTRAVLLAVCLVMSAGLAAAEPAHLCLDPHHSYEARSLNQHDVFARNSIGKPRQAVRLTTSCINLEPAIAIGLSSSFTCIGLGDPVSAHTIDGHSEQCVVTKIQPYQPQQGDKGM